MNNIKKNTLEKIKSLILAKSELFKLQEMAYMYHVICANDPNSAKKFFDLSISLINFMDLYYVGVKCDAKDCNYHNTQVSQDDMHSYVDKPCPLCGENLLTKDDYEEVLYVKENKSDILKKALTDIYASFYPISKNL